ncbi:MAG: hypothetical protein ACLSB9_31100 [Hydrogeniiclostridium mannosilyticum]
MGYRFADVSLNDSFDATAYLAAGRPQFNAILKENLDSCLGHGRYYANGMGSAEHYQLYGFTEGIATSDSFDSARISSPRLRR